MKKLSSLLIFAILLSACSRKSEKTTLEDAPVFFGPTSKDIALELAPRSPEALKKDLRAEGAVSTADYLRLTEDLKKIASDQGSPEVARFSRKNDELFQWPASFEREPLQQPLPNCNHRRGRA